MEAEVAAELNIEEQVHASRVGTAKGAGSDLNMHDSGKDRLGTGTEAGAACSSTSAQLTRERQTQAGAACASTSALSANDGPAIEVEVYGSQPVGKKGGEKGGNDHASLGPARSKPRACAPAGSFLRLLASLTVEAQICLKRS